MPFNYETDSKAIDLKRHMLTVMDRIKKHRAHYLQPFLNEHPEYNNREGIQRIRSVVALIRADVELTKKLEAFAVKLEQEAK